jgi:hypothetical protein
VPKFIIWFHKARVCPSSPWSPAWASMNNSGDKGRERYASLTNHETEDQFLVWTKFFCNYKLKCKAAILQPNLQHNPNQPPVRIFESFRCVVCRPNSKGKTNEQCTRKSTCSAHGGQQKIRASCSRSKLTQHTTTAYLLHCRSGEMRISYKQRGFIGNEDFIQTKGFPAYLAQCACEGF